MSSYDVTVTFNAGKHTVRYWPGGNGNGRFYDGYATSLAQLKRSIAKYFVEHDLDLYIVSGAKKRVLTTDTQLRNHIERLPKGATALHLSAVQRKRSDVSPPRQPIRSKPSRYLRTPSPVLASKPKPITGKTLKTSKTSKTSYTTKSSPNYTSKFSPKTRITWVPVVVSN